jgi:hypothetical protein
MRPGYYVTVIKRQAKNTITGMVRSWQLQNPETYLLSRDFQRSQASARAFLLASEASGASPARMKP